MTVDATQNNPQVPAVPPGSRVARPQDFRVELKSLPGWVRPEVIYWYHQWLMIRDACNGERQIKDLSTYYLPALEGMEPGEYAAFAQRATYFNFSGRTISAMSGAIFRRAPVIEELPEDLIPNLKKIARDRTDFDTFTSASAEEIIKIGRYGVLLDAPRQQTTSPRPYLVAYTGENILDWDEGEDEEGLVVPTRWVLREVNDGREASTQARKAFVRYRELVLAFHPDYPLHKWVYQQYVYSAVNADAQLNAAYRSDPIVPLVRGEPLTFIPFQLFGPHTSSMAIEKPPMEDICQLNISHYRSYAYLEHGRFFVGFPVYTAEEPQQGGEVDYQIGSSRVWVVPSGGKAHILEMSGQGLKFLENALHQKEEQAASLGGKMLGANKGVASKGTDQITLEQHSEMSVLLKTTRQMDKGFTQILQWWAMWQGTPKDVAEKIEVVFNKDFLFDTGGAREFRAIHMMYKEGVIPIDVLYYYLKKNDIIPDWMQQDEFEKLLNQMQSFPNQPDAQARFKGFQTMQQKLSHEEKEGGIDIQQQEIDLQVQGQKDAKAAAAKAAAAPKPPALAGPQPVAKVGAPTVALAGIKPTGKV